MIKKFIFILSIIFLFSLKVFAEPIHVAFTIDNNYPIFTLLAINSILNNSESDFVFHIVEDNLSDKNKSKMIKYIENRGQNIRFYNIDINNKIVQNSDTLYNFSSNRITPIGIARIMLPELLSEDIHKVLYLDGDILVKNDISKLYNINIGNKYAGMVKNICNAPYEDPELYIFKNNYYNSGVILMNLDKWRQDSITNKMLLYLSKNIDKFIYGPKNRVFLYPDQDLINIILDGKIYTLDEKWNNQTIYNFSVVDIDDYGIIHYIGPVKPWTFPKNKSAYMKLYFDEWKHSSLYCYKYYYGFISKIELYKNMYKIKFNRYKNLLNR